MGCFARFMHFLEHAIIARVMSDESLHDLALFGRIDICEIIRKYASVYGSFECAFFGCFAD